MPFITFIPVKNGRVAEAIYLGDALTEWLRQLNENKSSRSIVKRSDFDNIAQTQPFNALYWPCKKLAGDAYLGLTRMAAVALLVARVRSDGESTPGSFLYDGGFSESRLKALLTAPDIPSFVRAMRSGIDIASRSKLSPDPRQLADIIYSWDSDYTRRNLALSYYGAAYNISDNGNAP